MALAKSKSGRSVVIHLKIKGKRTTASIDSTLADFVCLKLSGKLCKDAGKILVDWAQAACDAQGFHFPAGISKWITYEAIQLIASQDLKEKWVQTFE